MDGVVELDPVLFRATYPELAGVSDPQLATFWLLAGRFCDNTPTSLVTDATPGGERAIYLNMLMAHIATLMGAGTQGAARGGLVGRIASASQGSVNVSLDMPSNPTAAYFMQTQYGAMFWQATAGYRTMRYIPGCQRPVDPFQPW